MRRRQALGLLGAAALAGAGGRGAEGATPPVVGLLSMISAAVNAPPIAAMRLGFADMGFVEGRTIAFVERYADGDPARLRAMADELARRAVDVIVAAGGTVAAAAARRATGRIPIVFTAVGSPVADGLVASMSRPGGNMTGVSILTTELDAKRLELLCEAAPAAKTVAAIGFSGRPNLAAQLASVDASAAQIGRTLLTETVAREDEVAGVFARAVGAGAGAILVLGDPVLFNWRATIIERAAHHRLPAMYQWREFADVGGLMSYGPSVRHAYRLAGRYAARILRGESPATLPVLQPAVFQLVVNLRTAAALGLTFPPSILARADEIIE
jgi:putative tryptophan/tyrosine transport system substrate-binding protein